MVFPDSPSIPDAVLSTESRMDDVTVKAADVTSSISARKKIALFELRILAIWAKIIALHPSR
jgi:hypothetical protein